MPLALLLFALPLLADDSHEILLQRHYHVGQEWTVSGTVSHSITSHLAYTKRAQLPTSDRTEVQLEGQVQVVEVDSEGQATKASCVVEVCKTREPEKEFLPKGTRLTVELAEGGPRITDATGKAIDDALLAEFLPVRRRGPRTDDEVFGCKGKKAAGDSWPVAGGAFAEAFDSEWALPWKSDPRAIHGTTTLASVGEVEGAECLTLRATCESAALLQQGEQKHPALDGSTLKFSEELSVPLDPTLPVARETFSMVLVIKSTKELGTSYAMEELTQEFTRKLTRRAVK